MNLTQISPYIRVAKDSTIKPPWKMKPRVIFDYEFLYIKSGNISVYVNQHCYKGAPGDIFIFKPKQSHSITIEGSHPFQQLHIHFDLFQEDNSPIVQVSHKSLEQMTTEEMKLFREDITSYPHFHIPNKIKPKHPHIFENIIYDIITEKNSRAPYHDIFMKGLFIQLWVYLIREVYWNENPNIYANKEILENVKLYIEKSVHKHLSLAELAQYANMSKYHLVRLFKNTFGISPIQYHQKLRIQKAKQLILYTPFSLTEISQQLGFNSISSFSRCFKKIDGFPPSLYRKW